MKTTQETSRLPAINPYGNYSSSNYGVHSLCARVGSLSIYFSYKTPVAFESPDTGIVCRVNDWSVTTGKHLNAIQPDKKKRIAGDKFEAQLTAVLEKYNLLLHGGSFQAYCDTE